MNKKIIISGVVLVVVAAATAAFTVLALQPPPAEAPEKPPASAPQDAKESFKPFKQILAEQLGIEAEALEEAFNKAREQFRAQFPERDEASDDEFMGWMGRPGRGMGIGKFGDEMMLGPGGDGHWMKKTTIMHEFYQMGGGPGQMRSGGPRR